MLCGLCSVTESPFIGYLVVGDTVLFKHIFDYAPFSSTTGGWAQVSLPWGVTYGQLWLRPTFSIQDLVNYYTSFGCPASASVVDMQEPMHDAE